MPSSSTPASPRSLMLHALIVRGLEAWERGEPLDFEPELTHHPELAHDLEQFFGNWRDLQGRVDAAERPMLATPTDPPPRRVGPYELLERVAFGGMGIVYKARHTALDRTVAIKFLLRGTMSSAQELERFQREAADTAQLDHPQIVPIYEVGQHGAWPYLVMPFVAGGSLADRLTAGPMPPREAARIVRDVARALDYAHRRGIVHRDVKPGNILLPSTTPETDAPRACITDFGLAKRIGGDSTATLSGQLIGTPSYMAPEQAAGPARDVGPAADVYALGAVLYAALSGRPPFQAADPLETLRQVRETEPVPLRQLNPATPRDLETLALSCLAKAPHHRLPSAVAVADELDRYLAGRPLLTRPTGLFERGVRWAQREPVIALLTLTTLITAMIGSVVSLYFGWRAQTAANSERLRSNELEQAYYRSLVTQSDLEWRSNNLTRSEQLLRDCPPARRGWEWHYLKRRNHPERAELHEAGPPMQRVTYSPQGDVIAAAGDQGILHLWDSVTHELRDSQDLRVAVKTFAWSPRGDQLFIGLNDGRILSYDVTAKRIRWEQLAHDGVILDLRTDPRGERFASCDVHGVVQLRSTRDGQLIQRWSTDLEAAICLAFNATGEQLAVGGEGESLFVFDTTSTKLLHTFPMNSAVVHCVNFVPSESGELLLCDNARYDVIAWNLKSGEQSTLFERHRAPLRSLAIEPRQQLAASGDKDGRIFIWELRTGKTVQSWNAHHLFVFDLAWGSTRGELASCGVDGRVRIWDVDDSSLPAQLFGPGGRVNEVAWSDDGKWIAAGSQDGTVQWWNSITAELGGKTADHGASILAIGVEPQGKWLASAAEDGGLRQWELASGRMLSEVKVSSSLLWSVAVARDGKQLAWSNDQGELGIVQADGLHPKSTWSGHRGAARCVRFHPTRPLLVSCGDDGWVRFWGTATGRLHHEIQLTVSPLWYVAMTANGKRMAVSSGDGQIMILDPTNGATVVTCNGHAGAVYAVSFSPDGSRLASAGFDQTVRIWDPSNGMDLLSLRGPTWSVNSVAFSPDGKILAAGSSDWSVHWWR